MWRLGFEAAIRRTKDGELADKLFFFLKASGAPFEQVMFDWRGGLAQRAKALAGPAAARFYQGEAFESLARALGEYEAAPSVARGRSLFYGESVRSTLLYDDIEALWAAIAERDDWSAFEAKLAEIERVREAYGVV